MSCASRDRSVTARPEVRGVQRAVVGVVMLLWSSLGLSAALRAAEPRGPAALEAYLSAGEFGPASRLARETDDPGLRDQMLQRIAAAQAGAGLRRASLSTAAAIADDAIRGRASGQIASTPVRPWNARGGGVQADFDSLIELITSTIAPQSWDAVGGPGAIQGFEGGCYVHSSGLLRRATRVVDSRELADLRLQAALPADERDRSGRQAARRPSSLRKVSLRRLERALQLRAAQRLAPRETMSALAGMTRVRYVFVYPERGDVVLAGPAGDWTRDHEGRRVSVETGQPVLQLDDLVVLLRNALHAEGRFGCSITPTQQGLAATRQFLEESSKRPLRPGERDEWLETLQTTLGRQDIDVYGIDPRTRAALVMVEADYRMKLVGMGLEPGVLGVRSYLESIPADDPPPSMNVLRWWFTLNYDAVLTLPSGDAFQLRGPGVKVLSENELLTEQGKRQPTGRSDELTSQFARDFTRHFDRLSATYPVYAELRNIFDLAVVSALVCRPEVRSRLDWDLAHYDDPRGYVVPLGTRPAQVDSVVNHRVIDRRRFVAGVSGGVAVDTRSLTQREALEIDQYGLLDVERKRAESSAGDVAEWWWD